MILVINPVVGCRHGRLQSITVLWSIGILYCLVSKVHAQLAQSRTYYAKAEQQGIGTTTSLSRVRCPSHYTTPIHHAALDLVVIYVIYV